MNGPLWFIVCEDGELRHEHPFGSFDAAVSWADHGHICTAATSHRVVLLSDRGQLSAKLIGERFWHPIYDGVRRRIVDLLATPIVDLPHDGDFATDYAEAFGS